MTVTAAEQLLLELINRARLDPAAEARRLGTTLNEGLAPGTIGTAAQQVLAYDAELGLAALRHSTWMLEEDTFSHTGVNGTRPADRVETAGYDLQRTEGNWKVGENIAMMGSTGSINPNSLIVDMYEQLFYSENHRVNTLYAGYREIGVAQVEGQFTQGRTFNTSMLTEDFAFVGDDVFLTGVAFRDGNGDDFYGIGEGRAGYWLQGLTGRTTTADAGGYRLRFEMGEHTVRIGQGTTTLGTVTVDLTEGNGKLDIVVDGNGAWELALSASARLGGGITAARLLGSADLNLTGSAAAERLTGNKADNILSDGGGSGADRLIGMGGDDLYVIGNARTQVIEAAGAGRDRVAASVDYILSSGASVELLTTGNAAGTAAIDLTGNSGMQAITGNAGDNILSSGGGGDRLDGRGGNDTYRVFSAADTVVELAGGGTDIVKASVSYALASDAVVEALMTNGGSGTFAIDLTGNGAGQTITGNAGANRLDGKSGADVLTGGLGADVFVFSSKIGGSNIDRITDFDMAADRIALDDAIFAGFKVGNLAISTFTANSAGLAADAGDRVIYDTDSGALWFDADGSGAGAAVQIARLAAGLKLDAGDFMVV